MRMNLMHFNLQLLELKVLSLLISRTYPPLTQINVTLVNNQPTGTILDIVFENIIYRFFN